MAAEISLADRFRQIRTTWGMKEKVVQLPAKSPITVVNVARFVESMEPLSTALELGQS